MKKIDMSEQAILRRLQTGDRLRELCFSLMKGKKKSGEKAEKLKDDFNKPNDKTS